MASLLVLNTGSSSVKFRLFSLTSDLPLLAGGKISDIGGTPVFQIQKEKRPISQDTTHRSAVEMILQWVSQNNTGHISAVAHRIVHGGTRYTAPVLLDNEAMTYLRSLEPLAPLHQPHNLAAVDILFAQHPDLLQYGCFDTAYHTTQDSLSFSFALPKNIRDQGVRRYGFHGLSYDWIAHCLKKDFPHLAKGRVVAAHLGNGASLCAMKNAKSVSTSMGMTALDGLPMGTRCGAIDAGAVIYLQRDLGLSLGQVEHILYEESGLKGLSGITNDVQTLSNSDNESAKFALDYFILKAAQGIAAMAVSIGGMDGLIFTGGIGENSADIRQGILDHLAFLPDFESHIIAANEERSMAQDLWDHFKKDLKQ